MAIRSLEQRIRRFLKSTAWRSIEIGVLIIVMLLFSPVIIPISFTIYYFELHQKRQAANRFPCTNCDRILGAISIELADTEQHEFMQRLMLENPGMKIRPADRTVYAICSNCGTKFNYSNHTGFDPIDDR